VRWHAAGMWTVAFCTATGSNDQYLWMRPEEVA